MRWEGPKPDFAPITPLGWVRFGGRFGGALGLVAVFMPCLVACRMVGARHVQARLSQIGSRLMLRVIGLRLHLVGQDEGRAGAVVANHSSWLDIFVLYAAAPGQFVAKAEVARWPGIGILGRLAGTVFIDRKPSLAQLHLTILNKALRKGERLIFFPEGTSTDGQRILTFRTTLFGVFFGEQAATGLAVQPCFVHYRPAAGIDPRSYGFYAGTNFAKHMIQVLAMPQRGQVTVTFGAAQRVDVSPGRKALARELEAGMRALAPAQIANRSSNALSERSGSSVRQTSDPSATKST